MIAKNTTKTTKVLALMWNSVGKMRIAPVVPTNETASVAHFKGVAGMQSEAKFKKPV